VERSELELQARKYTSPYYSVLRAKIVLLAAAGLSNDQIGAGLSVPRQIVSKWRKRFFDQRTTGLQDEPRSGRPPAFSP
jgi:transposase